MTLDFRIDRYRRDDRDAVFAFLCAAHSQDDSARLIRQWDWKYDANPCTPGGEPYVLLVRVGTEIAGMLGSLPLRVVIDGREHWASHSCEWAIAPAYRNQHLARRLTEQHRRDRSLRFAWQNELSHRRSQIRPDTGTMRLNPLIKPLVFGQALLEATGSDALARAARFLHRPGGASPRLPPRCQALPEVAVHEVHTFDERFDALWQRVADDYRVAVVRDSRYLTWRFLQRPDAQYTILAATRGAEVVGYLVLRSATAQAVRRGYLVDFLVQDRSAPLFASLLEHGITHLRETGATAISCRATLPPYRRVLYRHAFVPWRWGPRSYLRVNVNLPDPAREVFCHPQHWFITMGDGDLEMSF